MQRNVKKLTSFLKKKSHRRFSKKTIDGLFENREQFIIDNFFMKFTPFEKTGSIGKDFISLRNLII